MRTPMSTGGLERLVRAGDARRAEGAEHCGMCSAPIAAEHRHLYDAEARNVMCVCRACTLLFNRAAASNGHYRLVPEQRRRVPPVDTTALGVPVGLAFFVRDHAGQVSAHYPSPAGATEWLVDREDWASVVAGCPPLAELEPEVEAFLVNTARGQREFWVVPVDDCFRLVAVVRTEWRGLSGGSTVWPAIGRFFEELDESD